MSAYDTYESADAPRRHKSHRHHHRDREDRDRDRDYDDDLDGDARYVETRETYVRGTAPVVPDAPYPSRATDLIRRREDSELSIEEVRRDFPPPAGAYGSRSLAARDDRYGPPTRSRSVERGGYGDYLDDPREERHSRKKVEKEVDTRRRSLSRNQKILAGVAGAALAVGGKELWDRRQNHGQAPEDRNILGTAAVAAGGAFAGYEGAEIYTKKFSGKEKKEKKKTYEAYKGRDGEVAEYYSEEEVEKPKKSHRKSLVEGALGLAGIGAAGKALVGGHHDDDRSDRGGRRSRRRSGSESSGRSRKRDKSRGGELEGAAKFQQAAKAALLAGAAEAFRVRKEPGGWSGAKGKRVLTAAIGAGSIDAAADKNPDHHGKRHILEAVVGGLAGNRLINGSRHDLSPNDRRRGGRSRSRSRAPSSGGGGTGLAALATAGLGALAGKKLLDSNRSRSRGPDDRDRDDKRSRRNRSPSEDSYDSRDDKRDRDRRRRSKSVTDYARKGLAALGLGEAASEVSRDDRRRDRDRDRDIDDSRPSHRSHRRGSDESYDDRRESTRGDPYDDSRDSRRRKDGRRDKKVAEGKQATSDSESLGSSSGDEKRVKKMKAHSVYQSYEKRKARTKAVASGQMSKEEARKLKSKAVLQDAASIGIATLGIKGAVSEWKEMKEMRHEYKEFEGKRGERHQKRVERQKHLKDGDDKGSKALVKRKPESGYASAPDLPSGGRYSNQGPTYADGNPYASGGLPEPPIGYAYEPRR